MVVRLFLGGLPHDISAADLRSRFSPFGKVETIEIIPPKDHQIKTAVAQMSSQTFSGEKCRGFAYIELDPKDEASVHKCLSVYNHSKWRGNVLRVELAKPSYLARLHVEWQEQASLEEKQPQQVLQTAQQSFDSGNWFLPRSEETAAPTRPPCAKPSQSMHPLPPLEVSAASLAAATAAADAAAAKRAKAATHSSRPTGPVPPPAPADLSQPLNLPNPHNRRRPIEVNLAQPAKPPRRSFPAVTPLPLSRLEWQRDEDFGELLRAFSDEEEDEDDFDGGNDSMTGGGSITENGPYRPPLNTPPSTDGGAAARPRKRSRTELPLAAARSGTLSAAAGAPSVLYYLNHVWAQPMSPYTQSAAAAGPLVAQAVGSMNSHYGVSANMPPSKQPGFLQQHIEQGRTPTAETGGKGSTKLLRLQDKDAPVVAAGAAAVINGDANEGAASAATGSRQLQQALPAPVPVTKREVRGEMLSMFKVLKAIDSETRKRSAEEAAAARVMEARATTAVGSWKGPKGAKQQQQQQMMMMMALRGQANASVAVKAGVAGGSEEGGDGVVNFLDRDEAAGSRYLQQQTQQLMLDKFDDSDELGRSEEDGDVSTDSDSDSDDFHGIRAGSGSGGPLGHTVLAARPMRGRSGSNGTGDAKLTSRRRTAKASSIINTLPPVSLSAPPVGEPQVPRVVPPSAPPMAEPKVPRVAPRSALPMEEPQVPRVVPPSAPPMAEPKVPRVAPFSVTPGMHSRPSKRSRELSDAVEAGGVRHGAAAAVRSAPSRRLSAPDAPLVPIGPHRGGAPGGRRGGAPAEDLLARFGGDNDSDCEVFHDVDSTDLETEDVSGRVQGAAATTAAMVPGAPATAAAVIASKRLQAVLPSAGWVSFLDDVEEDGSRAARSGKGRSGMTLYEHKVIGSGGRGSQRRQSGGGRGRAGGGRGIGTPARTASDSVRKGGPPAPTPTEEPHVGDGQNSGGSRDAEALEAPVRERQRSASAPSASLLVRQKQQPPASGGPLLATSFVRPAGSSDEELRAAWSANFGGLVEGARDNVRTAQRAIQGRAGAGGARRGTGSRRR